MTRRAKPKAKPRRLLPTRMDRTDRLRHLAIELEIVAQSFGAQVVTSERIAVLTAARHTLAVFKEYADRC